MSGKKKIEVLSNEQPEKVIRGLTLSRGKHDIPQCTRCTAPLHRTSRFSRGETILCIKQKAAQYDIPRVSYLRFVHISSVSRTWRDHIGIRQPTAVYTTYTMRACDIFIIIHVHTLVHQHDGCACGSHITVVKRLHFRFGERRMILSNSKWCSDYDKTK